MSVNRDKAILTAWKRLNRTRGSNTIFNLRARINQHKLYLPVVLTISPNSSMLIKINCCEIER